MGRNSSIKTNEEYSLMNVESNPHLVRLKEMLLSTQEDFDLARDIIITELRKPSLEGHYGLFKWRDIKDLLSVVDNQLTPFTGFILYTTDNRRKRRIDELYTEIQKGYYPMI